ncbi:MAG: CBS domain-containing protein [Clostridia bacterium]|nr:CBS domain-containing protein [Clostridia bacterium]
MNIMRFVVPKSLVSYIDIENTVRQALEKMRYHRYVAIPVLDGEGKYVGTLKNDDILSYLLERGSFDARVAEEAAVGELISRSSARPLYHTASMGELIESVKEHNFVPVVDDRGCFVGIILRRDVLNYLLKFYNDNNENDGGSNNGR